MWVETEDEVLKQFKKLFLKSKGQLHKDGTSLINVLNLQFDKTFLKERLLQYISREYYLKPDALSQQEKEVFKNSPWFPELRLNLKYPTVFDVEGYVKSPNSSWELSLRENKNSFLVFLGNEYITELTLDYKVNSFAVWKDYLVVIDESKVLRVIYLYSLKEVHKKEDQEFKEVRSDKDRLYLVYEDGIIQAFKLNEIGINFDKIVRDKVVNKTVQKTVKKKTVDKAEIEKIEIKTLRNIKVGDHEVRGLSFSPDGKLLAVSVILENKVMVFSTDDFKKIWEIKLSKSSDQVKFSPDGKYLAVGCDNEYAYVYDVLDNFKEKYKFKSHKGWVAPFSFSPDGNLFAFGGSYGYLALYDFKSGNKKFEKNYEYDSHIYNIFFSPSGKYLAVGRYDGKAEVLTTNADSVMQFDDYIKNCYFYTLSFSPDGRFLAYTTENDKVKFISVEDWKPVKVIDGFRFAFSDDGKYIFTTHNDKVMVWNLENFGKVKEFVPYKGKNIYSIAVNSKAKLIACGYDDGYLYVLRYEFPNQPDYLSNSSNNELPIKQRAYKLRKVFWTEPYIIFIDENNQAYGWQKEGEEFVYKFYLGELKPSQEFKDMQNLKIEGWRVDKDFILFKDSKVAGSKEFEKHVNVLLGGIPDSFQNFKDIILTKPLEVL